MRTAYSFSVLRYVHDPLTQEFINIGVAVYAPEVGFLRAICTKRYGRISRMFAKIDGARFRQLTDYIQERVSAIGESLPQELPFEAGIEIEAMLAKVLPKDDSTLQFSAPGVGLSRDLEATTAELFARYVEQYATGPEAPKRNDEDVWQAFRAPLEARQLTTKLAPKEIVAPNYSYSFAHAWKNGVWHVYEPMSFDLVEGDSIVDKANRWLGRGMTLHESEDPFTMHLLLGEPSDARRQSDFDRALKILDKMPVKHELIREREASAFAERLEREMREHEE